MSNTTVSPPSTVSPRVLKKRLTEAVARPEKIFEEDWYQDEAFCLGFFDRCEDEALAIHPRAFDLAQVAVKMAVKNGDRCLENRAHGVLSHAHIARRDRFWAGHVLGLYRDRAFSCCGACKSNFLLREGDLFGEEREVEASLEGWRPVHDRRFWTEGQLHGRLGNVPMAYRKLAYAQNRLLPDGLLREALAVSLDGAQIRCRPTHRREDNLDQARKALERCLNQRQDLDQSQREGLCALLKVIQKYPRFAFEEIGKFRRSFIAPVPGQFGERIGSE